MTPERLAEWRGLKEVLRCIPDDPCAYDHTCRNHRSLADLLTALREAQAQPPPDLVDRWMKNELADYAMVLHHCSVMYSHFTNGRISKPNTLPEEVIRLAEDLETQRTEEAIREAISELAAERDALQQRVETLEKAAQTFVDDVVIRKGASAKSWEALKTALRGGETE